MAAVAMVADTGNPQSQRQRSNSTKHDTTPILPKDHPGKDGRFCVAYFEPPLWLGSCGSPLLAAFRRSHFVGVLRWASRVLRRRTLRSLPWFRRENLLDRITVAEDDFQSSKNERLPRKRRTQFTPLAQIWRRAWPKSVWNARPVSRHGLTACLPFLRRLGRTVISRRRNRPRGRRGASR